MEQLMQTEHTDTRYTKAIHTYAQVIVDIAHTQVDRFFTYAVPKDLPVCVGSRVLLPFGRGNKKTEAFVIRLLKEAPDGDFEIKAICKLLDAYPVFSQEQLALAFWMQDSYNCLLVDALRLMIPAQLRKSRVKEKKERMFYIPEGISQEAVKKLLLKPDGTPRAPKQAEVFCFIRSALTPVLARDIHAQIENAQSAVSALIKKGLLAESGHITFRRPEGGSYVEDKEKLSLSFAQIEAIENIEGAMQGKGGGFLLHGVTGSGKTEVYMQCIRKCIAQGKTAILLVPEISLTPQAMGLFRSRFGDDVAVLHSRLSAGERYDEWRRIRLGMAKVAIGARSAVFAPFDHLGLIIIDEEHEQSYQSESAPRYHAVEIARRRCAAYDATLVLGSATPAIQSYFRAQQGIYTRLDLPERVNNLPMPAIQVVDMREEFLNGNNGIFSGALYIALEECLKNGKQAILFINRRGYSTFVSCRGCGHVFECPHCDISMTYHKTEERVKCHYCGHSEKLPTICPNCARPYVKYFGVGTQQVEEQLRELFPGVRTLRMDLDTTRTKDAHERMFTVFSKGEADVLIGTQMVAKGLDFPNVTLVGVVAADSTLHLPDYRSSERTFQLIMQVAGRAGRAQSKGTVVVQSYTPKHPSILFAAAHDYKGFYTHELLQRRAALFPPFALFIRILLSSENEAELIKESEHIKAELEKDVKHVLTEEFERDLLYASASPAPIKRRQGIYRYQVLLKLLRTKRTTQAIKTVYAYFDTSRKKLQMIIEINPGELF